MRQVSTVTLFLVSCLALWSCSGTHGGVCLVNCTSGATVSVVLTATPPPPSAQLSAHAFTATITGISLTPASGGNPVDVTLTASTYVAEFTRVTSDSTLLASQVSVPTGTYSAMTVHFSAPRVTFCTQASPGVPGCATGSLTNVSGPAGSATITTTITIANKQLNGLALNANLGKAMTQTGQSVTGVDLTIANVFSVATLPPSASDLSSGELSHLNDIMGVVTNVSSPSITIQTASRGSVTAKGNSSTQYECATQNFSCVKANDIAVVDGVLNSDGTITLTFYESIVAATDWIEGLVVTVPNSVTGQFTVVATDSVSSPTSSVLSGRLNPGDQVVVTLAGTVQPFTIIDKGLGATLPVNNFNGGTSVTAIQPGMTVAFPVTSFTPQSGTTPGSTSTTTFVLRFTRVTAAMANASLPDFSANTFPPFLGIATTQQMRTTSGRLSVDGAANLTSISIGGTISVSALYLGTPATPLFAAESVRVY